jgi:hypothetical protein
MELEECNHRWAIKKHKGPGVLRKCKRCKKKILELAIDHSSPLDKEFKELWPKGKHRKKD